MNNYRLRIAKLLFYASFGAVCALQLAALAIETWGLLSQQVCAFTTSPLSIRFVPVRPWKDLQSAAEAVTREIERRYPPKPLGWKRLWPSNWEPRPGVPPQFSGAIQEIKRLGTSAPGPEGVSTISNSVSQAAVTLLGMSPVVRALQEKLAQMSTTGFPGYHPTSLFIFTRVSSLSSFFSISPIFSVSFVGSFICLMSLFVTYRFSGTRRFQLRLERPVRYVVFNTLNIYPYVTSTMLIFYLNMGSYRPMFLWFMILGVLFSLRKALMVYHIPPNPYMELIEDLKPFSDDTSR